MISRGAEAESTGIPRVLQMCANDRFAFYDICRSHAEVLTQLGFDVTTVFFAPPTQLSRNRISNAFPGKVEHLGLVPLKGQTRRIATQIRKGFQAGLPDLIVAHRYRAFRVAMEMCQRAEPGMSGGVLGLAHEYGFLRGWRRRRRVKRFGLLPSKFGPRNVPIWLAGVSKPVADELTDMTGRPSLTIPNVIDVDAADRVRLSKTDARRMLGLNPHAPLIGFVGRLEVIKNPMNVLLGFNAARTRLPQDTQLVYLGDGTLRDALQQKARTLGVANQVQFPGFVADARRYLAGIDALVVPASPEEAFGMVLLEAMLARVPVICADSPGPNTVLQNLGVGFELDRLETCVRALESTLASWSECETHQTGASAEPDSKNSLMSGRLERARQRVLQHYSLGALAACYRSFLPQLPPPPQPISPSPAASPSRPPSGRFPHRAS